MPRSTDPTVRVHRIETARGLHGATIRQLFIVCPLCGREHMHGGGDVTAPIVDGHRVAHCGRGGYRIECEEAQDAQR